MKACIHRGSHQIGGTCIELESQGKRIVLDLGIPLDAEIVDQSLVPPVKGLLSHDPDLLGVIISHLHADHVGLSRYLNRHAPIFIGRSANNILQAAAHYIKDSVVIRPTGYLENRKKFSLGPFTITPYLVDHSAFDAYALLIEADGKRLFYSGDFRAHGRKPGLFERMIEQPPENIDILLLEGSSLERLGDLEYFQTEADLENDFVAHAKEANRPMLVWMSSQNIDRMVTVYRAAVKSGRHLIMDMYCAEILSATGRESIPQIDWPMIDLFVPTRQRIQIKRAGHFGPLNEARCKRIFERQLAAQLARSIMIFRPMMIGDLEKLPEVENAKCILSMWPGNLKKEQATLDWFATRKIEMITLHTSGHASIPDLKEFARALDPKLIVPIHTFRPDRYPDLFSNVVIHDDGKWWEV